MDSLTRRKLALQAATRAQLVRAKCNIAQGSAIDPISVAVKRGCEVRFMSLPSLEGVYSPIPTPVIVLGSQRPSGRRAYTCAHELGHHEFEHGTRIEELNSGQPRKEKVPDEFLADMFAAFLLMSQGSIRRALKEYDIQLQEIEPMQIFRLASYFGVGYGALINHMTWTLKLLNSQQMKNLLRIQPKELKAQFDGTPQSEVVIVDEFWRDRTADLEIGDILVLHRGAVLDNGSRLVPNGTIDDWQTYKAISKGYMRAFDERRKWAINIRISSKQYEGLAQYRFLDDPEEKI